MRRNTIKKCEIGVSYMLEYGWSINYSAKMPIFQKVAFIDTYIMNSLIKMMKNMVA